VAKDTKILVIDDDPDLVEAMKVVLESKNYRVVTAESGEEGLEGVRSERPDLIILDVMMETRDKGFEVSRKIRSDEVSKNVPILMLTAVKEETGTGFARQAGDETWLPVDAYLEKPLKPDELLAKVEELLRSA
jgi:DNA-binding response OmpR family regulator